MNLLQETLDAMDDNNLVPNDISFIGSSDGEYQCTWDEYKFIANFEYDDGYGGQEVACDLVVRFNNGIYFDRGEYDGSEWWDINGRPFESSDNPKKFTNLRTMGWMTSIEEIDKEQD